MGNTHPIPKKNAGELSFSCKSWYKQLTNENNAKTGEDISQFMSDSRA
jgi:hypothetical protein